MLEVIYNAILPNILEIIGTVISLICAYYIIPYIKEDLIPWLKEQRTYGKIKNFVQAVEKMAESGLIKKEDKKQKVIELLARNGITVNATIEAFIESAVKELDIIASVVVEEIIETEVETGEN